MGGIKFTSYVIKSGKGQYFTFEKFISPLLSKTQGKCFDAEKIKYVYKEAIN